MSSMLAIPCLCRAMSNLRVTGAPWDYYTTWRSRPGVAGHAWFVSSGWQQRTRTIYALACEVAEALGDERQ